MSKSDEDDESSTAAFAGNNRSNDTLQYKDLRETKARYCASAPTKPELVDVADEYPPRETRGKDGTLVTLSSWRGGNMLKSVVWECPIIGQTQQNSSACGEQVTGYAFGLAPFAAPLVFSLVSLILFAICMFLFISRRCRQCRICRERSVPRKARPIEKNAVAGMLLICSLAIVICAVLTFFFTGQISTGVSDMLCALQTLNDEVLNGSENSTQFMGVDIGLRHMEVLRQELDVDGPSMTKVREILDVTAPFEDALGELESRLRHMELALSMNGAVLLKDHRCEMCLLSLGNNDTRRNGLIGEIREMIDLSAVSSMRRVLQLSRREFIGTRRANTSEAIRRGLSSLSTFRGGFAGLTVESLSSYTIVFEFVGGLGNVFFSFLSLFCLLHAAFMSNITLRHAQTNKDKYPNEKLACFSWFCGFIAIFFTLLSAGAMLLLTVPTSDLCNFFQDNLFVNNGSSAYFRQLNLSERTGRRPVFVGGVDGLEVAGQDDRDVLATTLYSFCFTANGTGSVLGALDLDHRLAFRDDLARSFVELQDRQAARLVDTAKLDILVEQARSFGGLFTLNPDVPKALDPTVSPQLFGSSVDPDDQPGPDGRRVIGLNTYASLIADNGAFIFESGTTARASDSTIVITTDRPSDDEIGTMALARKNAVDYARLKEQLLDEELFRCDVWDIRGEASKVTCDHAGFRQSVVVLAKNVQEAGARVKAEAEKVQNILAEDLRITLDQTLKEVLRIQELLKCRFFWRRWEDFDRSFCGTALSGMINSTTTWLVQAAFTGTMILIHYKIWRHFLDNKVVGKMLEHMSRKYGYLGALQLSNR